jgi:ribosome maturation factor RimP
MINKEDITQAAAEILEGGELSWEGPDSVERPDEYEVAGEAIEKSKGGLFLVEVKSSGDEFEVFIDNDQTLPDGRSKGVSVDDCVKLTRAIESRFNRDETDFALTVSSAGIGQPLRHPRQFKKLIGRQVELVLTNGAKIVGTLEGVDIPAAAIEQGAANTEQGVGSITVSYPEKQKIEGKKRPEIVEVTKTFALSDIKTTKEHIDFK